jgi:hypothetical protein
MATRLTQCQSVRTPPCRMRSGKRLPFLEVVEPANAMQAMRMIDPWLLLLLLLVDRVKQMAQTKTLMNQSQIPRCLLHVEQAEAGIEFDIKAHAEESKNGTG